MRISGGSAKGRRVGTRKAFVARGEEDELRPTSAKVRQAVFDILGERLEDSDFLDLYAGSGAVGIEALSRGAGRATFVERNSKRADLIRRTADEYGFKETATVVKERADAYLRKRGHRFDIIFVDPPYAAPDINEILTLIDSRDMLKKDGTLIVEHSSKKTMPDTFRNVICIKSYRYGDTALTLYRKEFS